jgi:predicted  nucleic acid-binding Zn-ribbon protein
VHPDVATLLEVQTDDIAIHELENGIAQLLPRVTALAAECERARLALAQARQQTEAERKRRRDVEMRVADHRQLHDKNQAVLNTVTSQREATAAMAQLEQVSRIIADEEREISIVTQRIDELEKLAEDREATVNELDAAKAEAEASVSDERQKLEGRLGEVRSHRDLRARTVPRPLLSRYDRIRSKRRIHAVFPVRGNSCSNCDTVIPLQRRTQMSGSGATELCEGCGVLLYATE